MSPSWVEPLDQPPELVGAITAAPVTTPPVVGDFAGPLVDSTLFRSVNVIRPSPLMSVRLGRTLAGISAWLSQRLLTSSGLL